MEANDGVGDGDDGDDGDDFVGDGYCYCYDGDGYDGDGYCYDFVVDDDSYCDVSYSCDDD